MRENKSSKSALSPRYRALTALFTVNQPVYTHNKRGLLCVSVCVCSAGAGRTGTFCALSTVLERVKAEGILDVFQTVKSLRLQRPHMVQTLVSGAANQPITSHLADHSANQKPHHSSFTQSETSPRFIQPLSDLNGFNSANQHPHHSSFSQSATSPQFIQPVCPLTS